MTVCLGNICRSPVAEAAIREAAAAADVDVEVDSAGTGAWHVGNPPDERMQAAGAESGLDVGGRARQVTPADLDHHDLVVAMDASNLADLQAMADQHGASATIRLFRSFDPDAGDTDLDVPDPYYGGPDGFSRVVEMMRPAAAGVVDWAAKRDGD
nr:low molecular weight protein-tyrosine-phosphatase [Salsipaludibacter albus]